MAGNGDGFVANRSRTPFGTEMIIMLEEGCLPEQVDKVMIDFGYPIGPFATADLSGLDIGYDSRQRRAAQNPNYRKLPIADAIWSRPVDFLEQKTGAGWFRDQKGDRTPHPDPEVARIIREKAAEMGVPQRTFTDEEILRRQLFASVNEACRILDEGKAYRARDIDVMWLNGFGFPRYRGGLMYWADDIGVAEVYRQIPAVAPAIRRALDPVPLPAPPCRNQHPAPRSQTRPPDVITTVAFARTLSTYSTPHRGQKLLLTNPVPGERGGNWYARGPDIPAGAARHRHNLTGKPRAGRVSRR